QDEELFERTRRSNLRACLHVVRRRRSHDHGAAIFPARQHRLDDVCGAERPLVRGDGDQRCPPQTDAPLAPSKTWISVSWRRMRPPTQTSKKEGPTSTHGASGASDDPKRRGGGNAWSRRYPNIVLPNKFQHAAEALGSSRRPRHVGAILNDSRTRPAV